MNINIELNLEEVNTILRVLSKHPFEEVVNLIGKIKQQGEAQVAAAEAAAAEKPAEPAKA